MDGEMDCSYTVEDVFKDFRARRVGIIKALTIEVKKFRQLCDPGKENLCLYAYPDQTWEVKIPSDVVPEDSPEPIIGINFARDGMKHEDWLSLVAMHSSAWLISLAFYFGARFGFDKTDRMRLFKMINDLPSLNEIISISVEKETKKLSPQTGSNMKNEIISYSVEKETKELSPQTGSNMKNEIISYSVEKETKELSPQSNSNIKNEIAISDSFEEVTMELSPQTSSNIKNRTPKRIRKHRRKHRKCSH